MRHVAAMQHSELMSCSRLFSISHPVSVASTIYSQASKQSPTGCVHSQRACAGTGPGIGAWGVRCQRPRVISRCRRTSHTTQATDGDRYIDLPEPKRQSVALPRALNSAGRIFTLAGLLKILVIAHGAVPWSAISGWEAIVTMVPFGLALVLVARFLLQINFMQRRGSMFLVISVAALVIAAQAKLAPQTRRRTEVAMQPAKVGTMQQDEQSQQRPLPSAEEAEQIWDQAEKRAHEMQAAMKEKTGKKR